MPVHPRSRPGLPVELWRDIFLISVELHLHLDTYSSLSGAFAPLVLTRVCSRWREVALADGRLWRNLVLFHAEKEKTMWIVQRWAERSRPYQLSVRIRSHDSVWIISDDDSAPRFLERVEYLDTVILGDTSKSVFLPTHTTRLPLKELSLDLRTWTLRYQTNLARLLDSLEHATHLRLLSLDYPSLALMPARFPQTSRFPFAQLTTLHLRAQIDDTTLTRFLHCCPLLETLLVPAFFRRFPESGAVVGGQSRIGSTIVLPHLRRLEFSAPSATLMNERCLEFFAGATLPALQALAFPERCSDAAALAAGFGFGLSQPEHPHSGCTASSGIISLTISDVQHPARLLPFFALHETIERLRLENPAVSNLFAVLCTQILPRLRVIELVLSIAITTAPRLVVKLCDAIFGALDARRGDAGAGIARLERMEVVLNVDLERDGASGPGVEASDGIDLLRRRVVQERGRLVLVMK